MTMAPNGSNSTTVIGPFGYPARITDVILQYNPVEGSAPKDEIVLHKVFTTTDVGVRAELLDSTVYETEDRQLVKPGKNYTLQYYHILKTYIYSLMYVVK